MSYYEFQSRLVCVLFLGAFVAGFFPSNVSAQRNNLIESVDILGNRLVTDKEMLEHIKTRPGNAYDEKQVQDDLQALLKLGIFDPAHTKVTTEVGVRGGINVIFEVTELPPPQQTVAAYDELDTYAIYSMLLRSQRPLGAGRMKRVLLSAETHDYGSDDLERCLAAEPNTDAAVVSLVRAYQQENKNSRQLARKFDLPIPYELIKEETFRSFFKDINAPGWNNFFKEYPDSGYFFNLSGITFAANKTRALVHVGYGCGFNCGKSSYHLLEKHDGKWTEVPFLLSSYSCGVIS